MRGWFDSLSDFGDGPLPWTIGTIHELQFIWFCVPGYVFPNSVPGLNPYPLNETWVVFSFCPAVCDAGSIISSKLLMSFWHAWRKPKKKRKESPIAIICPSRPPSFATLTSLTLLTRRTEYNKNNSQSSIFF